MFIRKKVRSCCDNLMSRKATGVETPENPRRKGDPTAGPWGSSHRKRWGLSWQRTCSPTVTGMAVTPRLYGSAMADKYASKARQARRQRQMERCNEKKPFSNEQSARRHNRGQRPYRCNCCESWHLASYKVRTALRSPIQP